MVTSVEAAAMLAAALMGGLVARLAVPTRRTVLAAGPWTVTAALAVVAARMGAYDALAVEISSRAVIAAVAALATGSWAGSIHLADLRGLAYRDRYLAATGSAAAVILGGAVLFQADFPPLRLAWFVIAPTAAALLAAVGYFLLGLVYTDALAELRLAGLYTLGAIALDGVASAVVVEQLGGTRTGLVTTALDWLAGMAGVDPFLWALLPGHVVVGMAFVGACGWASKRSHAVGLLVALLGSIAVLWAAAVLLVATVLLG
ncbi:hypothetical protein [Natronomonas amylolytica]|uniref:hypothetical protein n=1 Tax=Natronomonas amylolytica TaxID=3108498 RepID=UPI003009B834